MLETIERIERLTKTYADARSVLNDRVQRLNDEIESAKRRLLPGIKKAVNGAAVAHHALKAEIANAKSCFVQPRTIVVHGIRVGYQKKSGKLKWDDDARVITLIRKHMPDNADALIITKESVSREALKDLPGDKLKRIGVNISGSGDSIIIKPIDGDVDKIVQALLKDADSMGVE